MSAFGPASSFKYLNIGKLAFYDDIAGFDSTLLALQAMNISMDEVKEKHTKVGIYFGIGA